MYYNATHNDSTLTSFTSQMEETLKNRQPYKAKNTCYSDADFRKHLIPNLDQLIDNHIDTMNSS